MKLFDFWKALFDQEEKKRKAQKRTKKRTIKKAQKKIKKKVVKRTQKKVKKEARERTQKKTQRKPKKKIAKKIQKKVRKKIRKAPLKTPKKKKSYKQTVKSPKKTIEKEIGIITHCFGKISVGIIRLKDGLGVGDRIHIKGVHDDHTQVVKSMQLNHKDISYAKAGLEVGIKVTQPVHENDKVYRVAGKK